MKANLFLLISLAVLFLSAEECNHSNSDDVQRRDQERISQQCNTAVGMPSIVNCQEKKWMKMILEMRDNTKLATYTYIVDMQGKYHLICNSIGFGLPYAVQFTNPQRLAYSSGATLPQADPNGLFSPPTADGTWVLCLNPETNKLAPIYVEPRIIVSTFKLK
jgi:hypothetical protein